MNFRIYVTKSQKFSHHPHYRLTHTEAECSFSVLIEELICYVLVVVTVNVYLVIKLCGITSCKLIIMS